MAGPGLPVNIDTTYPDSGTDASVKTHQQHHDTIHTLLNAVDTVVPTAPVLLAGIVANNQTGTTYTLVLADAGKVIELNNAAAITLSVPTNTSVPFPVGTCIELWQQGAGQVNVTAVSAGNTAILAPGAKTHLSGQYASATLRKRVAVGSGATAEGEWCLEGDLA